MSEGPALSKGPDAFRTISEVAEDLDLPQHVLRFWETRFPQIRPMKRGGGRRYYRPDDVELLRGIRRLLYGEGYTIKGVQRILKEHGPRHVVAAGQGVALDPTPSHMDLGVDFADGIPAGVLVDDDWDLGHAPEPVAPPRVSLHRGRSDTADRREPVFEPFNARPPAEAMLVRSPVERPAEPRGRSTPQPIAPVSRIPVAPPEEPEDFDAYLPPLNEPPPPERRSTDPRGPSIDAPVQAARQEPRQPPMRPTPSHADEPAPGRSASPPRFLPVEPVETALPMSEAPSLSHDDVRQLKSVLFELLECKRILDQAR